MKKLTFTSILTFLLAGVSLFAAKNRPDEYLGLPGDNLNLYAVMNLFQESETLEGFERKLNDPEDLINNLDLNGDNYVDYIMVYDYVKGDIHDIVLRVALNEKETQDVAVFTVWKLNDGSVQIQLIGDEALYGPNYIVEPIYAETPNPGYRGAGYQTENVNVVTTTYYEVATWPMIVFISRPGYRVWRSSWYWGYYPSYWHPWTPHYYHYYYGYHYNYHSHYYAHYRPWKHYRHNHYHNHYYTNIRNHSSQVTVMVNNGSYKKTYSRPDTRKEGEVLYAKRNPRGSNLRKDSSVNEARGTEVNSRATRPESEVRSSPANTRVNSREQRAPSNAGEKERVIAAPSRKVNQPSTESRREERRVAPARESGNSKSEPAKVERTGSRRENKKKESSFNPFRQRNNKETSVKKSSRSSRKESSAKPSRSSRKESSAKKTNKTNNKIKSNSRSSNR